MSCFAEFNKSNFLIHSSFKDVNIIAAEYKYRDSFQNLSVHPQPLVPGIVRGDGI